MTFETNEYGIAASHLSISFLIGSLTAAIATIRQLEQRVTYLENELKDIKAKQGE